MMAVPKEKRRNKTFDLLRIAFALLVLLSHAAEFTDGNRTREIFTRLTGNGPVSFGELGVDGFFLLSGYLITQSWSLDPRLGDFLQKRILRIVPGWLVAVVLSTVVVGFAAPAAPHFFHQLLPAWRQESYMTVLLGYPVTPPVYPSLALNSADGPLWTIPYEFKCYLLVAILGVLGVLKRRWITAGLTMLVLLVLLVPRLEHALEWHHRVYLYGEPTEVFRLGAVYLVGVCFYSFRNLIHFRPWMAAAAIVLLLVSRLQDYWWEPGIAIFGGYLLFYLGHLNLTPPAALQNLPDISYGLYLYGGVVEALWIDKLHTSPWITFAVAAVVASGLGWVSWHVVERPMLRLKRRPTAVLPPA